MHSLYQRKVYMSLTVEQLDNEIALKRIINHALHVFPKFLHSMIYAYTSILAALLLYVGVVSLGR
ncbi:hypothetical protein GMA19_02621 [Paenibacillus polymyxa E681]|nr:hypothetical protein PPE_05925 [Paenibacillus polymyxa E681]QNV57451.1 hypothetical protein GE561_02621 [Paenibacillus polymyxa E681]QNV62288.1 hypothetical protein GMA19_02621 [Paenibacillus polymyxa E681]